MKKKIIVCIVSCLVLCCFVGACYSTTASAKAKKKTITRKYSPIYIGCKQSYKTKELLKVYEESELNNKRIKWSCTKKQVKVTSSKCKATKVGTYTLVGKLKKKKKVYKYKVPLIVLADKIPQITENVQNITIRSLNTEHINQAYKNVNVSDLNVISDIRNRANGVSSKYDFAKTYNPLIGGEGYIIWFTYADGRIVKLSLNSAYVYRTETYKNEAKKTVNVTSISCCYSSSAYNEFYQYIESLYVNAQG